MLLGNVHVQLTFHKYTCLCNFIRPAKNNLFYSKGKITLLYFRDSLEKENEYSVLSERNAER
jgi:hypothetical protein